MQDRALTLLEDLESLSRQLCEGYSIDLRHAEKVIGLLADVPKPCQLQRNDLEGVDFSMGFPGPGKRSRIASTRESATCLRRMRSLQQMSEALMELKLGNDELEHRVSFVNAAIEFMNSLRRQMKISLKGCRTEVGIREASRFNR